VEVIMVMVNDFVMKALVKGSLEMELNKGDWWWWLRDM
jgi:hypothetical protein